MSRLTQLLNESLWLITEERYAVIRGVIEAIERGTIVYRAGRDDDETVERKESIPYLLVQRAGAIERMDYAIDRGAPREDNTQAVLIVPFSGTIYPRMGPMAPESGGGTNMQQTMALIRRAVADPGISSIIGDFDSPGGMVAGVPEAAAEIRSLRGIKPMTAVASFQMASAAYYLGSQFDEVVASPSSSVGSIGVVAMYSSAAKALENEGIVVQTLKYPEYKAEADGVNPLSDEAFAFRMEQIKKTYNEFEKNVALGLRIERSVVAESFGRGRSLDAADAVKVGAAHRLGTFDDVLSEHMTGKARRMKAYRASRAERGLEAEEDEPAKVIVDAPAQTIKEDEQATPTMTAAEHAARWNITT